MRIILWQTKRQKILTSAILGVIGALLIGSIIYANFASHNKTDPESIATQNGSSKTQADQAAKEATADSLPTNEDQAANQKPSTTASTPAVTTTKTTVGASLGTSPTPTTSTPPTVAAVPAPASSSPAVPAPAPTPPAAPGSGCTPLTTGQGGYPLPNLVGYANDCNTGPRYACTTTQGTLTTSYHGQVIDRMCINGSLEIRHNNVTVRDVLVMGTGTYALDIGQDTAVCPSNLRVEYTEINMTNAANMDWGIYQRCAGGHVFDHIKVMYAGRGIMTYGNLTLNQSYVYSNRTQPDAHRTAFSTHGGANFTITGNTLICVNTGCSSSLNIYSDYAPATNILIQSNVVAGGSICMRGGETHAYATQTHDIRVLNNRFSTVYAPQCGTLQAFGQFDAAAPGNVRSGNVWHESGTPITGE